MIDSLLYMTLALTSLLNAFKQKQMLHIITYLKKYLK